MSHPISEPCCRDFEARSTPSASQPLLLQRLHNQETTQPLRQDGQQLATQGPVDKSAPGAAQLQLLLHAKAMAGESYARSNSQSLSLAVQLPATGCDEENYKVDELLEGRVQRRLKAASTLG